MILLIMCLPFWRRNFEPAVLLRDGGEVSISSAGISSARVFTRSFNRHGAGKLWYIEAGMVRQADGTESLAAEPHGLFMVSALTNQGQSITLRAFPAEVRTPTQYGRKTAMNGLD